MTDAREYRSYKTADVVLAFARYGVALDTLARALVIPRTQVEAICRRAIEHGTMEMMPPGSADDRRSAVFSELVTLRSKLDEAQLRIAELQADFTLPEYSGIVGLSNKESTIVTLLMRRGSVTKQGIYTALYSMRHENEQPEPKIVDVFICKLRHKLRPLGIEIQTIWGQGYALDEDNAEKIRKLARVTGPAVESPPLVPELACPNA